MLITEFKQCFSLGCFCVPHMLQELAANPFYLFIKYVNNNKEIKWEEKIKNKKLISYSFKGKNGIN